MKSKTILSITILLILSFSSYAAQKSIAVMNIQSAEVDPSNCIAITNYMTSELNRLLDYRIISWDDVNKMLEHHAGLQAMGCDDTECFAEIGGALGVDYIIAGDIGALGDRYVMTIRQIDINRAETVGRVSRRVTGNIGLLMDGIPEMVGELFGVEVTIPEEKVQESSATVTDIDGNVYNTVQIGNQIWTVENFRATRFNDGTPIPNVTDDESWSSLNTPAYCYYYNNRHHAVKFGALYNWYAVNTGRLAPEGWRVPTDEDWKILQNYLTDNGYNWDGSYSGNKIAKALASQTDWEISTGAGAIANDLSKNNSSGFSALPGGYRSRRDGSFRIVGAYGGWWSATERNESEAWQRRLHRELEDLGRHDSDKRAGLSVRLVRDN